ncbi:hypothetical protein SLEP1_g24226 [Rubroshorea leprosula]|uniref:Uncharacterized protein n=1 Tax=Rubroshorea leprosula TaxID=152421 RepID=A0AAV5JQZ3_9ROSI|nr:hypothetical protein SLEP1_g24226 [Rubroshorea leprosula]
MGNCFGKGGVVDHLMEARRRRRRRRSLGEPSSSSLRVNVRMTRTELEEMITRSQGNSDELARLILRECLEGRLVPRVGRLVPRVVVSQGTASECSTVNGLSRIDEENENV